MDPFPFLNEPEAVCDGCRKSFPESALKPTVYRYHDEEWQAYHFCAPCAAHDRKLDEQSYSENFLRGIN